MGCIMGHMYGGTILQVDLSEGKISREPTASYSDAFVGGRGINIKILYDSVPPEIAPLDPANVLIFGAGPLAGSPVSASRTEVTAKSPESGFLGSANFGGYFAPELKFAGYDHIVFTGRADKPVYLWIENERVEIRDASGVWGKDTYETQAIIRSEVGPEAQVACIGQAGENLVHFATIQHGLGHAAGRTGLGGVMGSKNLKAIVVRGTKEISIADPEKYLSIVQQLHQEMRSNRGIQHEQKWGVSFAQDAEKMRAAKGKVPRPVFSSDVFLKYGPKRTGCFGCSTQCMDLYSVKAQGGGAISCSLYVNPFYTVRNDDLDVLLECSLWAQRYGVDSISAMGIVAFLMELHEHGVITAKDTDGIAMEWGSKEAILGMFKKIVYREGFGDVLADGILPAADRIGRGARDYANHMKGMPLYESRTAESLIPAKGHALSMAMSPRGDTMRARATSYEADALGSSSEAREKAKRIAGTEKAAIREEYEGKPELVIYSEDVITINDCLSACKYMSTFLNLPFDEKYQAALFSVGTGIETSEEMLFDLAKKVRNLERAFCVREGMTRDTDSLPKRFMDRPVEQGPDKGAVLKSDEFEKMKSRYYALRGWDIATGIPTREALEQTGLGDVAEDLDRRGKLPGKPVEDAKQSREAQPSRA
ncbi:MAG: aldehyde ferredoxin oxidoreductase family protein [Dehalococcoidia bacterium]